MTLTRTSAYSLVIAILAIGLYGFVWPAIGSDFSLLPGDSGDTRFNLYVFEQGYQSYFLGKGYFWDAPFMFPQTNTIALSDNLLGSMPLYALFRAIGQDRETALQCWFIAVFILNFGASFFIYKRISGHIVKSAIAAFVFTFAIPVMAQINHVQLLPRFAIPFIFYAAWRFTQLYRPFYYFVLLTGIVYQMYCGMYSGMLTFLCVFVFMLVHMRMNGSWKRFSSFFDEYRWTVSAITLWAVLFAYPIYAHYIQARDVVGMRSYDEVKNGLPQWWSYFFPANHSYVWQILNPLGQDKSVWWEHVLFFGLMSWSGIVYAFTFRWRKSYILSTRNNLFFATSVSVLIIMALTIAINQVSLFYIVRKVIPGFASMRSITRIVFPLLFLCGLCIFPLLESIQRKPGGKWLTAAAMLFAIGEQVGPESGLVVFSKKEIQARHQQIIHWVDTAHYKQADILVLLRDDDTNPDILQLDGMMVSQQLGMKTINGYSSSAPGNFGAFWSHPDTLQLHRWLMEHPDIDTSRIRTLIIHESDFSNAKK